MTASAGSLGKSALQCAGPAPVPGRAQELHSLDVLLGLLLDAGPVESVVVAVEIGLRDGVARGVQESVSSHIVTVLPAG